MLHFVRWALVSGLTHLGLLYAGFIAVRHPEDVNYTKLWIVLSTMFGLSIVFESLLLLIVPMYLELRCMLVWCLMLIPPTSWGQVHDKLWKPFVTRCVVWIKEAKHWYIVRRGIIAVYNFSLALVVLSTYAMVWCGLLSGAEAEQAQQVFSWLQGQGVLCLSKISTPQEPSNPEPLTPTLRKKDA